MTTLPKRLAIKFNLKQNPSFATKDIVPVFQRWIQEHAVEGMLIDVVDYKHVQDGPGVVLIADEGDYGYDLGDGKIGLKYTRKRFLPDNLQDAMRQAFRLAFVAAQRLEDEDGLDGIDFDFNSAQISFLDRQYYPNTPETFEAVQAQLVKFLLSVYGGDVSITQSTDDPREVFTVAYTVAHEVDLATIESNLLLDKAPIA